MRSVALNFFVRQVSRAFLKSTVGNYSRSCHITASTIHSVEQIAPSEVLSSEIVTMDDEDRQLKRILESPMPTSVDGRSKRRRKKNESPLSDTYYNISMAAKESNKTAAMDAFRSARDAGLSLPQSLMNSVLYALVGGERWIETAVNVHHDEPKTDLVELEKCRDEVLAYMEEREQSNDEMVYIAQSRLAACLGNSDDALEFAREMIERGLPARLRAFTPALVGFAEKGERTKAKIVESMIDASGLDVTELELRLLLKACTQSDDGYPDVTTVLKRLGNERTYLETETIDIARTYFTSAHARGAFADPSLKNKQLWLVKDVEVDNTGFNLTAGDHLSAVDLKPRDWEDFIAALEKLALSKERKGNFQTFVRWLQSHGPYPWVIDGANVAFHKQNFDQGAFQFDQIERLMEKLSMEFPERKALLVLHVQRTKGPLAEQPKARAFLTKLQESRQLFTSPIGSNDDCYWLYAALIAKEDGYLISNDECRDHIFQLLAPKYFLKWKERHLVRFEFLDRVPYLQMPSVYTSCVQQLSNGTWMLPYRDAEDKEKWLCAKPC